MKIKARKLTTFYEKSVGLMGRRIPEAVFLETHFGIHTFFMRFPIDIVVLDAGNKVGFLKEKINPYRFLLWSPVFYKVLELPEGTIKMRRIKVGETIEIVLS